MLAPTGTIGFMMDCDTTGVEPDIALVKYKRLVGGGLMKIVNHTVPVALGRLGYPDDQINSIVQYVDEHDTIEGAPHLDSAHLAVFDCAFKPARGSRFIHYMGHLKMIGATQPFISGAISKTINVPTDATVEDVERAYLDAWRLGAKAVSIYRDGSKRTQPLNTARQAADEDHRGLSRAARSGASCRTSAGRSRTSSTSRGTRATSPSGSSTTVRPARDLPGDGQGGIDDLGFRGRVRPGHLLLAAVRRARCRCWSTSSATSAYVSSRRALTKNPDVRVAKSIVDYVFRWMATKFLSDEAQFHAGVNRREESAGDPAAEEEQLTLNDAVPGGAVAASGEPAGAEGHATPYAIQNDQDAPPCSTCGAIMIRNGACYKCVNCGATSGCA